MSTSSPNNIQPFKFNWYNYLFPVVLQSDTENDGAILSEWLEDFEERLDHISLLSKCSEAFGKKLQFAVDKLCDDALRCCFDFYSNSESLKLFKSEQDAVRYLDSFFLDTVVGTYIRFYDDFIKHFRQWEFDSQLPNPNGMCAISMKQTSKVRKQRPNIPKEAREILSAWFKEHVTNPYPKLQEKERLSIQTGLSLKKVENWFINERSRKWHLYNKTLKPRTQ